MLEAVEPAETDTPEALGMSVTDTARLPLTEGLVVSDCVGALLREGVSVYDRLTLGVREGAEADGEVEPTAPPGVTLGLADRLPVLEAADEGEASEADIEGLLVEEKVCCDLVAK